MSYWLDQDCHIKIFSPAYFLATKLESFKNRGGNDGRLSTDFEAIVYILNNRTTLWEELNEAEITVKNYIIEAFEAMIRNKYIGEWISVHLDYADMKRQYRILQKMKEFVNQHT